MKIFIDIGHPAHVHYFRNFIYLMEEKGHEFFVSARERSIIHYLLDYYKIQYSSRGKGGKGIVGKLFYMILADIRLFRFARRFKPDIFLSFASPYAAQVSKLFFKPHIAIDDTEHARFGHIFYKPFTDVCLNPSCFQKDFGKKQIRFNSFTELFYLHKKYFSNDNNIRNLLKLKPDDAFAILRLVSWDAHHDIGQKGLDFKTKDKLINILKEKGFRVFISSESEEIDIKFKPYLIDLPPEKIHHALQEASILVTESGTMASEAAVLGTPVIYVNSLPLMGYLYEQQLIGALYHFSSSSGVIAMILELINKTELNKYAASTRERLLSHKINPTTFLVWFIENFPESFKIMKENPDYQDKYMEL